MWKTLSLVRTNSFFAIHSQTQYLHFIPELRCTQNTHSLCVPKHRGHTEQTTTTAATTTATTRIKQWSMCFRQGTGTRQCPSHITDRFSNVVAFHRLPLHFFGASLKHEVRYNIQIHLTTLYVGKNYVAYRCDVCVTIKKATVMFYVLATSHIDIGWKHLASTCLS